MYKSIINSFESSCWKIQFMRAVRILNFNLPTLIINQTLIDFGMYMHRVVSWSPANILDFLFSSFTSRRKNIRERRMRSRNVARTHEFSTRKSFHGCPRVLTRVSETERGRAFVLRERGLTREHAAAWNTHAAHSRVPSITAHAIPQCEKPFFPPRTLGRTHARARTVDEDDASSSEFTRTGEPPPRLKILSVGRAGATGVDHSSERPFTPRLRQIVPHANSSSVARGAGDGGTPLDGGDDAGTSSLPLSTPRSRWVLRGVRAGHARPVYIPREKHDARGASLCGKARRRGATQVETDRRRAAAFTRSGKAV